MEFRLFCFHPLVASFVTEDTILHHVSRSLWYGTGWYNPFSDLAFEGCSSHWAEAHTCLCVGCFFFFFHSALYFLCLSLMLLSHSSLLLTWEFQSSKIFKINWHPDIYFRIELFTCIYLLILYFYILHMHTVYLYRTKHFLYILLCYFC